MPKLTQAPSDHPAVEAARKEVRSSLVAKYARYAMRNLGRDAAPPFDVKACITASQANAFRGTVYALGKNTEEIRSKLAAEFRREFAKLKVV